LIAEGSPGVQPWAGDGPYLAAKVL
jgi:hypothetical protein